MQKSTRGTKEGGRACERRPPGPKIPGVNRARQGRAANVSRVLLAVVLLTAPTVARAAPPRGVIPTRITYVVEPGSRRCPDEAGLRAAVKEHLFSRGTGNPFVGGDDSQRIAVEVGPEAGGYQVKITLYDADGGVLDRFSPWRSATCASAVEDAAGAMRGWLVPLGPPPPAAKCPAPAPAPVCAPVPVCPAVESPPVQPAPQCEAAPKFKTTYDAPAMTREVEPLPKLSLLFGASLWGEQYGAGLGALGFGVDAGLRYGWGSLQIEAKGDPPFGSTPGADGNLSVARVAGALVACGHYEWLAACFLGETGEVMFPVAPGPLAPRGYGALGIRLGVEFPVVASKLFLPLQFQLLKTTTADVVDVEGTTAYQNAGTQIGLSLGVLFARETAR